MLLFWWKSFFVSLPTPSGIESDWLVYLSSLLFSPLRPESYPLLVKAAKMDSSAVVWVFGSKSEWRRGWPAGLEKPIPESFFDSNDVERRWDDDKWSIGIGTLAEGLLFLRSSCESWSPLLWFYFSGERLPFFERWSLWKGALLLSLPRLLFSSIFSLDVDKSRYWIDNAPQKEQRDTLFLRICKLVRLFPECSLDCSLKEELHVQ